jgi:hypothetical protein
LGDYRCDSEVWVFKEVGDMKKLMLIVAGVSCYAGEALALEKAKTSTQRKIKVAEPRSKRSFNRFYLGLGGEISRQLFRCKENQDFAGGEKNVKSAVFGPTVFAGFNHKISPNFAIGLEGGLNFDFHAKQQHIGNVFSKDSARFRELVRDVNTLFVNIGNSILAAAESAATVDAEAAADADPAPPHVNAIEPSIYLNFVNTMKYLGGMNT